MLDFPITENQIRVLDDNTLREVLELCQSEHTRRQKQYYDKLVDDTSNFSSKNISD
tara:strand:- start:656 stop:823 length:168 start_codon:yes stop_codon:yes gene_type:complete